jgi:uncharacterized protein (DUF1778 family)
MRKERRHTTTVSVRLTDEEYEVLGRLCTLKKMSRTGYLTRLATSQAKKDLLDQAVGEYLAGEASLSELAKRTGLDVPTIMDGVAKVTGEDKRAVEGFLSAVKALSEANKDPEFYTLAVKTIT